MKTILVTNGQPQRADKGYELAIFEQHPAHKNGELFIGDGRVYEVALTKNVKAAINDGRLKEVNDSYDGEVISVHGNDEAAAAQTAHENKADAAKGANGDVSEGGNDDEPKEELPFVEEGDTIQSLKTRYSREKLEALADAVGVADPQDYPEKKDLAAAILQAANLPVE